MKAPNKIYTDNRGVYAELPIFSQIDANVEYIRKEALLEWVEKEFERLYELIPDAHKVEDETATPMEMRYLGQYMQMESVIDKLNQM